GAGGRGGGGRGRAGGGGACRSGGPPASERGAWMSSVRAVICFSIAFAESTSGQAEVSAEPTVGENDTRNAKLNTAEIAFFIPLPSFLCGPVLGYVAGP